MIQFKMLPPTPMLLLVGATMLASGCLPLFGPVRHHPARGPAEVAVPNAPPPPKHEEPGDPPQDGWVWYGGHWKWGGGDYHWEGGHWEAPRQDADYVPPSHRQTERGWVYRPPHWRKHGKRGKLDKGGQHGNRGMSPHGQPGHHAGDPNTPHKVRVNAPPAGEEGGVTSPPEGHPSRYGRTPAPPAGDEHLPRYRPDKIKTQREGPPVDATRRAPQPYTGRGSGHQPGPKHPANKPYSGPDRGVQPGAKRHVPPKAYKGPDRGVRPGAQPPRPSRSPHRGTDGVKGKPPQPVKRPDRGVRPGARKAPNARPVKRPDQDHRAGPPARAKKPPRRKAPDTGTRGGNVVKGKIVPEAPGKPRVKPPEGPQVPARGKNVQRR